MDFNEENNVIHIKNVPINVYNYDTGKPYDIKELILKEEEIVDYMIMKKEHYFIFISLKNVNLNIGEFKRHSDVMSFLKDHNFPSKKANLIPLRKEVL